MKSKAQTDQRIAWARTHMSNDMNEINKRIEIEVDGTLLDEHDDDERQHLEDLQSEQSAVIARWVSYIDALRWVSTEEVILDGIDSRPSRSDYAPPIQHGETPRDC